VKQETNSRRTRRDQEPKQLLDEPTALTVKTWACSADTSK